MSDRKDIDFDTLPSSSDDLIDEDLEGFEDDELDEDLSFDDVDQDNFDEDSADLDIDEDEENLLVSDDREIGDEDEDEELNESKSRSIVKDVAVYGGGGIFFIGVAAYYIQSVLGISVFGSNEQYSNNTRHQQLGEIESRSEELRNISASEVVQARDSTIFDVDDGWDNDEQDSKTDELLSNNENIEDDWMTEISEPSYLVETEKSRGGGHDIKEILEEIRGQMEDVVKVAVEDLLTKEYFDQSISSLEESITSGIEEEIKGSESRVTEFIQNAVDSSVIRDTSSGANTSYMDAVESRSRIPNINIIDTSVNGEMVVVQNSDEENTVLSSGDDFVISGVNHKVTSIIGNGLAVLIGDDYFIDRDRVFEEKKDSGIKQDRPSRSAKEDERKKAAKERLKAEKVVADSLLRDYNRYKISYGESEGLGFNNASSIRGSSLDKKDYVMSFRPPADNSIPLSNKDIPEDRLFTETPRQQRLVIAEGWSGNMIMGDEFLVIDPSGSWRKLVKGDRVVDFNNNLVHGLDARNNLIIGNHVIIFD